VNKPALVIAFVLSLVLTDARSQAPKPLTEGDLFKSIDQLNGEPPLPKPATETATSKKDKTEGQTEITADGTEFSNKIHIAIFTGQVIVKNPDFNVVCDKLTAYLKHDEKPAVAANDKKPVAEAATAKPPADAAAPKSKGGLEKAIAEMQDGGKVVITQDKKEADGSTTHSIGKAERAVYTAINGEVTLTGWPEITQGINRVVPAEDGVTLILYRDGRYRAVGRTKTLLQDNEKSAH
jgi:lipopolysaccharide export system protein LptA